MSGKLCVVFFLLLVAAFRAESVVLVPEPLLACSINLFHKPTTDCCNMSWLPINVDVQEATAV